MHGFGVLFCTLVRHYFGLSVLRERLRRRQQLWKPALSLAVALVVGIPLLFGYVKLLQSIYNISAQLAQPGLIVVFGLLGVQLIILVFGLFYLMSVFYYSSDLECLVPMPLRPETILAAKFSIVMLTEYFTALPLVAPPLIIYGLRAGAGALYWVGALVVTALVPLLPLALAAIIAVLIMRFTSFARSRDAMRVFAGLISVALALAFQWKMAQLGAQDADPNQVLTGLLAAPNSIVQIIGKRFPPSMWGAQALVSSGGMAWRYMLAYIGSTIVSLGLLWVVARRYFFIGLLHGAIKARSARRRRQDASVAVATRSSLVALVHREFLLLVRTPIFAMTAALNLFLPPVVLLLPILGGGEQLIDMQAVLAHPRFFLWGTLGVAGLFAALAPLASIAPTAVSREGKLFWISQTIPVSPATQLSAKLIFSVLAASLSAALFLLVAWIFLSLPAQVIMPGAMLGLLALTATSAIALAVDAFWPRLEWENPQQAMKGNQNVLIAMALVAALGYGLVRLLIYVVKLGFSDIAVLGVATAVLAVLALVGLRILFSIGNSLYAPQAASRLQRKTGLPIGGFGRQRSRSVILAVVIAGLVLFGGREFLGVRNLDYAFDTDAIRFSSVELAYDEITDVQYLERTPPLSNRVGTSIGNLKIGTFTVRNIGRGKVYATDITKPALLLRTEETFYIITPDNADQRHAEVLQKISQ